MAFTDTTSDAKDAETPTALFDRLLDSVYPVLNRVHGFDGSRRFWAILLYRYLAKHMHKGGLERLERHESGFGRTGRGPRSIRTVLHNARYLPARACRRTAVAYLTRSPFPSAKSIVTGFHFLHVISRRVEQPASFLGFRANALHRSVDFAARPALDELVKDIDFPLARLALQSLPSKYVEEFRSLHESVQVIDPRNKEFHASMLPSIEVRLTIARHVEEGSRLSLYQHAGNYGEVRDHVLHHAESGLADRFRTWGWKLRQNDEPFLALRLMKPPELMFRTKSNATSWLFIIVRQPRPRLIKTTHAVQRGFFGALRDELAAKIVVRPRINKGGLVDPQIIDEVWTRVRAIDDGTSRMVDLIGEAELVILDMFPSTTFMECLTGGVPVLAIVPEATAFTENATRFYDEFFRVGLLQRSPESAAKFLNHLNVRSWWQEVSRLDCFREYLGAFCNRDVSKL